MFCLNSNKNELNKNNIKQADINLSDRGDHPPLQIASQHGCIEIVKLLVSYSNIDINYRDNRQVTSLWTACQHNHPQIVKLLLKPNI